MCEQVQIAECRNCRVVVGPCVGSVFLLDSVGCTFSIAAKQAARRYAATQTMHRCDTACSHLLFTGPSAQRGGVRAARILAQRRGRRIENKGSLPPCENRGPEQHHGPHGVQAVVIEKCSGLTFRSWDVAYPQLHAQV